MAKAKPQNGKDLMLWIAGKVVALSTSCKLNITANGIDCSTKDDGAWDNEDIGNMSWDCSNDSISSADKSVTNAHTHAELFKLMIAKQPIEITVGIPSNQSDTGVPEGGWTAPTEGIYKGSARIMGLNFDGTKGDNAKISINLKGCGALELVEAGPLAG